MPPWHRVTQLRFQCSLHLSNAAVDLPEARSGPALSNLVSLRLAASGSGDIRDLALVGVTRKKPATGMFGRLIAAMKGGF